MIELFTFDTDSVENTDLDAGENISHTLNLPDDANKQTCRWISSGEIVEIHGIKLTRGNFYVGEYFCLPPKSYLDNLGINKECKGTHIYGPVINPKLSINNGNISKQSFSTYNDMPSTWRYECVMWLSGEKCCTEIPIELLMFYLFGWEIRMFVDPQTPCSERKAMVKELIKFHRILAIEFSNPEYNGDGIHWLRELSDFIASAIIKFFSDNIYEFDTDGILSHSRLYANFYIGRLIEDDLFSTKGFDVACKVYDKHISFPSSCRSLAEKYFLGYFNKKRKNITANIDKNYKEKKSISYYSNYWKSNSSHSYFSYQMAIPYLCVDVLWGGIQAVRDKFWNYAHYKRWSSGGKDTIAALFSLPKEVNIQEIPEIIALTSTLDKEMLTTSYMIKPFNWLLELCEYRLYGDNNISLAEAHSLIDSLNRIGFGIVPNCKVGQNKLWHKADCLIYRNEGGYPVSKTIKLEKSDLFIKLATKIVNMDVPTNDDIILVEKYIQSHKNTIGNYRHLVASIRWLFFCK